MPSDIIYGQRTRDEKPSHRDRRRMWGIRSGPRPQTGLRSVGIRSSGVRNHESSGRRLETEPRHGLDLLADHIHTVLIKLSWTHMSESWKLLVVSRDSLNNQSVCFCDLSGHGIMEEGKEIGNEEIINKIRS